MTIVRVVEYTDLDGENHTKDFEKNLSADLPPTLNSNTQRKQTKLCAM